MSAAPTWAPTLREVFRREQRSFLQYVDEAYPWTEVRDEARVSKLRQIIAEEQRSTVNLANYLRRQRVRLPYSRSFPLSFTALHFVSLDFLLPQLIQQQHEAIAHLEQAQGTIHDTEPKAVVEGLLMVKRKHLEVLESLVTKPAAAAAPVPA